MRSSREVCVLQSMRSVKPAGIHLLGFKPLDLLKPHHNLREPTFIYPTDRSLQGSTTAFIALHDAMLQVSGSTWPSTDKSDDPLLSFQEGLHPVHTSWHP